ncbi:MAG: hypothetical protein KJ674_04405 [Nanoarchaeota archaeon]|nr:hypothetical protein [Nanoarchaeota archaeon]
MKFPKTEVFILIFILIFVFNVGSENSNIEEFHFNFEEPVIIQKDGYDSIISKDLAKFEEENIPIIPFKSLKILLPKDYRLDDLEVIAENKVELGIYNIEKGKEYQLQHCFDDFDNCENVTKPFVNITGEFPNVTYSYSVFKLKGYNILILNLYPMHYNIETGKLYYYKNFDVKVKSKYGDVNNLYRNNKKDRDYVERIIYNKDKINQYYELDSIASSEQYDYIIITGNELVDSFKPLEDWKNKKGVQTFTMTVENITANPDYYCNGLYGDGCGDGNDFNDTEAKVRNFIKYAYSNLSVDYVLLGGDVEIIPARTITDGYEFVVGDIYYMGLDGSWNLDNDSTFAEYSPEETDPYAEIYVGRAPVNTVEDVNIFINKTFTYERYPPLDYQLTVLFMAEEEGLNGAYYKNYIDENYVPERFNITKLYEIDDSLNITTAWSNLNLGYNIVNHLAHGGQLAMGVGPNDPSGTNLIWNWDIDELINAPRYSIYYSYGCYSNDFSYSDTYGEHFILAPNGGGPVYIGISGSSFSYWYDYQLFDALMIEDITNIGKSYQDSKEDNIQVAFPQGASGGSARASYLNLNLLGDPELPIWTDIPQNLTIDYYQESISKTITNLTINVNTENAFVFLYSPNYEGLTDYNGNITFEVNISGIRDINITVTAPNFLHYESNITLLLFDFDNDGIPDIDDLDDDNDGILDINDTLLGNITNINTNIDNLTLLINNDSNLSQIFNDILLVEFLENNNPVLTFNYDFSNLLDLSLVTINKENNNFGSLLVKGLMNINKTFYVDKINNSNYVCVKDSEIDNINEISIDCSDINEYSVKCHGVNNSFLCSLLNNSYRIENLTNSAVKEFYIEIIENTQGDPNPGNNNGGPGGGGPSGSSSNQKNNEECEPQWSCTLWKACEDGEQVRTCSDFNNCETTTGKPSEIQSCISTEKGPTTDINNLNENNEDNKDGNLITGQVTRDNNFFNKNINILILIIVLIVIVFGFKFLRKKSKKN